MNELFFWTRTNEWLRDGYQGGETYVFLARAMMRVGKALFPYEWKDTDPGAVDWGLLPTFQELATPKIVKRAYMLLGNGFATRADGSLHPPLSAGDWDRARSVAEERHPAAAAAVDRWSKVKEAVRMFMVQGLLPYVVRYDTGHFSPPGDPAVWNADDAELRFNSCKMRVMAHGGVLPIYIPEAALARIEAMIGAKLEPPPSAGDDAAESAKPRPHAFRKAYKEMVKASPLDKKMDRAEVYKWAAEEFGLGPTQAKDSRKIVHAELADDGLSHVWGDRGRPKGSTKKTGG